MNRKLKLELINCSDVFFKYFRVKLAKPNLSCLALFICLLITQKSKSQAHMELSGRANVDSISVGDSEELGSYMNWKKNLADKTGVNYELIISPQLQFGSIRNKPHSNVAVFFAGEWAPSKNWKRKGSLQWYGFYYQSISNYTTNDFARDQLINIQPNDGDTSPDFYSLGIGVLNWEQELTDNMGFRAGQLFSQSIYATNPYIEDDRTSFMASPLAGPYGINWLDYPIGLGLQYGIWSDEFAAYFGFQDTNANGQYPDFNSFKNGNFVYFGEIGYYPNYGKGENEGKYSITVSLTDSPIEEQANQGYGLVLNMFQKFHKGMAVFSRYSKSFDQFSFMKSSFVAGLAFDNIPIQKENRLGVAYMFSESFEPNDRDENGIEAYWRISVLDALSFTPDIQYYLTSAKSVPNRDVFIFSMRLNWTF